MLNWDKAGTEIAKISQSCRLVRLVGMVVKCLRCYTEPVVVTVGTKCDVSQPQEIFYLIIEADQNRKPPASIRMHFFTVDNNDVLMRGAGCSLS